MLAARVPRLLAALHSVTREEYWATRMRETRLSKRYGEKFHSQKASKRRSRGCHSTFVLVPVGRMPGRSSQSGGRMVATSESMSSFGREYLRFEPE